MSNLITVPQDANLDAKQLGLLQDVSEEAPSKTALFRRVFEGTASPRQAIKAHCLECVWFDTKAITECTSTACPVWGFRPFQKKGCAI